MSEPTTIDLEDLGLDRGAGVLLERALAPLAPGERLTVKGRDPDLTIQLGAWCRRRGDRLDADGRTVVRGDVTRARWHDATRAPGTPDLASRADATWGLAARGALVESGGPAPRFDLDGRDVVWADVVPRLYAQALANQWDPATAIDWDAGDPLPADLEAAVVQVMTYLVENETAALVVPARFLGRIHPYFQEVVQLLAVQVADEARHVEVFTRRARLRGVPLGVSGAGGRASLQTLLD
ncbi:MAG TPA: ferritin-like domain-containing protein, partial [Acidimicrobiia bacterium]|nr:ferritin-like domain-containing protein [Acidimicrobiia bacterium]